MEIIIYNVGDCNGGKKKIVPQAIGYYVTLRSTSRSLVVVREEGGGGSEGGRREGGREERRGREETVHSIGSS